MTQNRQFIQDISQDLAHKSFDKRSAANLALLAFDMGRAQTDEQRDYARNEYYFRSYAFVMGYGLKEALTVIRKQRK